MDDCFRSAVFGLALSIAPLASMAMAADGQGPARLPDQATADATQRSRQDPADDGRTRDYLRKSRAHAQQVAATLAASTRPRDRLVAARLLLAVERMAVDGDGRPTARADASPAREQAARLVRDAFREGRDDALVQWAVATSEARLVAGDLVAPAIANLRRLQPDNLAVWLIAPDPSAPLEAPTLTRAAAASHYDSGYHRRLAWYADTLLSHLPPEGSASPVPGLSRLDPEQLALAQAVGLWLADPLPSYWLWTTACKPGGEAYTAVVAEDCRRIARTLIDRSDTMIAARMGFVVGEQAALDRNEVQRIRAQRRDFDWQAHQYGRAASAMSASEQLFDDIRSRIATPEMTELRHMRETVLAAGGTLQAPADWISPRDRQRPGQQDPR